MAVSKVVFGQDTIIDLTADTVAEDSLLAGATAHSASGEKIEGGVSFITVYTGNSEPDAALGRDGDIFLIL